MKSLTHEQLVEQIRKRSQASTQLAVAIELKSSPSHINDILRGNRRIGAALAFQMGYVPVVTYRKIEEAK